MSGPWRQSIRPSLDQLKDLPPEFDDVSGPESDDDVPTYAPAAKLSRGAPPTIGSSSTKPASGRQQPGQARKGEERSVRFAESEGEEKGVARSSRVEESESDGARHQRFTLRLDDEQDEDKPAELPSLSPLVGSIQERQPATTLRGDTAQKKSDRAGQSRFAVRRQLDLDAGVIKPPVRPGEEPPRIQTNTASPDREVWLDEIGQPMSAFRKDRLLKQGLRPSSIRPLGSESRGSTSAQLTNRGAAPDEGTASLLQSVSKENGAKIAAMNADEVEDDLRDLQNTFGEKVLEMLKDRRRRLITPEGAASMVPETDAKTEQVPNKPQVVGSVPLHNDEELSTPEYIRTKYFPNEPESSLSAVQWMKDDHSSDQTHNEDTFRFDFSGQSIQTTSGVDDSATRLAGLHHHGREQDRPGYSVHELLHLARSTFSSQRVMALQTLMRVVSVYAETSVPDATQMSSTSEAIAVYLMRANVRGQACLIASWYIEDRHPGVRSASLACIRACLSSTLAGPSPVAGVEPPKRSTAHTTSYGANSPNSPDDSDAKSTKVPSIHDDEFRHALIVPLLESLCSDHGVKFEILTSLDILLHLAKRSREACHLITSKRGLLFDIASKYTLKQAWPMSEGDANVSALLLQLLLCLISSERKTSSVLVRHGFVEPMLRFIAVPPWTLPDEVQPQAWHQMEMVLHLYIALARYGIASDTYSRNHAIFFTLQQWLRRPQLDPSNPRLYRAMLQVVCCALRLFRVWTVCAVDAHQTQAHHDITWSQVTEWSDLAAEALQALDEVPGRKDDVDLISTKAEAVRLFSEWVKGAAEKRIEGVDVVKKQANAISISVLTLSKDLQTCLQEQNKRVMEAIQNRESKLIWLKILPSFERISQLTLAASALLQWERVMEAEDKGASESAQEVWSLVDYTLQEHPWSIMDSEEAIQAGGLGLKRIVGEFTYTAFSQTKNQAVASRWMRLASFLPPGTESLARDILMNRLPNAMDGLLRPTLDTLLPFVDELLRDSSRTRLAPLEPTPASLPVADSLFLTCQAVPASAEEDLDPLSGAALWKCANAGLPLRRDWPFVALDDLLHSGSCAALNRPDALPKDWDANELQIVRASFLLGLRVWRDCFASTPKAFSSMPSPDEIYMGIIKLFMLEEEQAENLRATGKITGRDIYRDEEVTALTTQLYRLAAALTEAGHDGQDDLERVAERQFGPALPFYQLYTSLIGLYDGISFGMELFARAVVIPLQMRYSTDYRQLLWTDYSHCLATITTTKADAPGGLQAYLNKPESNDGVIQGMTMALLLGNVQEERNGLLFAIAVGQLSQLIWQHDGSTQGQTRAKQLTRSLLSEASADGSHHVKLARQAILDWHTDDETDAVQEQARRQAWIRLTCH